MERSHPAALAAMAALEAAINRALSLDPGCARALRELEGRTFRVEIGGPEINVYALVEHESIQLRSQYEGRVDTHMRGGVVDFVELLSAEDQASALINGGIVIRGDSAPLFQLLMLLQKLDLDWEGALADWVGDVPAHQVGRAVRGGLRWGRQAISSAGRQAEEFLHEEARLLPPAAELESFYGDIQSLGLHVDRLEARLERMQMRAAQIARARR